MELQLAIRENFNDVEVELYSDGDNEVYMTIDQLSKCLGYSSRNGIDMLISRNEYLRNEEFSVPHKLWGTDNKQYEVRIFNEDGIYEVAFLSSTPRAEEFRAWVRQTLKRLRKGQYMIIQNPDEHIRGYLKEIEERQARQYRELNNSFLALFKLLEGKFPQLEDSNSIPTDMELPTVIASNERGEWKEELYSLARKVYLHNPASYTGVADVLSNLYLQLRNIYGFVIQEAKNRYRENHPGIGKIYTADVVGADEQLRNIALNLLRDASETCSEVKVSPLDEIIRPLIEKRQDRSPHGTATYRKVYSRMDVDWGNRETRYRNKLGLSDQALVRKAQLVCNSESMLQAFTAAVKELMEENCDD